MTMYNVTMTYKMSSHIKCKFTVYSNFALGVS